MAARQAIALGGAPAIGAPATGESTGVVVRAGMATGALLAGAVGMLALPSAVLAFSTRFDPGPIAATNADAASALESTAARLAGPIPIRSLAKGALYPFTPAGTPNRPDRSVTVAVRVDPATARAILVRGARLPQTAETTVLPLRLAPSAFNLGVSRGYHNFAQELAANNSASTDGRKPEISDIQSFSLVPSGSAASPRLSPRIVLDEKQAAGRAPRTFAGDSENQVDVGGSYRLTRNINVTAGVRYSSQERERLQPLTDGKQDAQAVYLGTQFRF